MTDLLHGEDPISVLALLAQLATTAGWSDIAELLAQAEDAWAERTNA